MNDQRFWSIIERSSARDQAQQKANLRRSLAVLPVTDLIAWQAAYDAKRTAAYSWDLWGAAYVIHGGASDDGFDYFRSWLIARGRRVYESALADPDSLATAIAAGTTEPAEFEGLGYVAIELWATRTGRDPAQMPSDVAQPSQPTGKPWTEENAVLAARYPKLWKRFGSAPLG
ncbi:DUF4240 domain-containing protein [Sphingomonas sp. LM7]|uniref:DUF4240 domain-containing protein n=1 Tax=Sphingomonas sp. LM7 TaxID=1938607 RepID=UPI000983D8E2|nr:DUF4240 domain-containing protein [Sphingomonas sp. LM7]AQR75928.1 hypothetical protein BXU08_15030 [Sphingomonas sp. LM7]